MKNFLFIMTAGILVCGGWGCAGQQNNVIKPDKRLPATTPWDLKELSKTPNFRWADQKGEVWSLHYQGPKYKGKSTRVFAYYSSPATLKGQTAKDNSYPAIVLVHGGGGKAFKAWAKLWAQRGYAAISMDLSGCGPEKERLPDGGPHQGTGNKFETIDEPLEDQWPYHAVANVILAHSLIHSFDEVDADRTAITGISWGGYLTCIVAGLDNRFKAAVPVYGCGFLHENSVWMKWDGRLGRLGKMSQRQRDKWVRLFDPSMYVGCTSMPIFFINGTNDLAYPLDSYGKTYRLVKKKRNLRITVNMKHDHWEGWVPEEIRVFVDEYLNNGIGLPVVGKPQLNENGVCANVKTKTELVDVQLHYTTGTEQMNKRKWQDIAGSVKGCRLTTPAPPDNSTIWFITVTDERGMVVSSELVFVPQSRAVCRANQRDYHFDGTISRDVLENYLSRSITMSNLYECKDDWQDSARMLKNIGAKFVGRSMFAWGVKQNQKAYFEQGRQMVETIHKADPQIILQAAIFEIITPEVNRITIPKWVLAEFSQPLQLRKFKYEKMLFEDGRFVNLWAKNRSVPDISRLETQMWYFYTAGSYINIGIEAITFGQIKLVAANDPNHKQTWRLLSRIRRYASKKARRHLVLCDSHVSSGINCYGLGNDSPDSSLGITTGDKLLFDFHALPLRIKEITDKPQKAKLEVGHLDSIYNRSKGGITPSGWKCEHLPYLVEFDNWGSSGMPGQSVIRKVDHPSDVADIFWIWGYDEITWFAHQNESCRNEWLRYAWNWVRKTDPAGFVQMPGRRGIANPINGVFIYRANAKSPACPNGFNQEKTIKAIWAEDKKR